MSERQHEESHIPTPASAGRRSLARQRLSSSVSSPYRSARRLVIAAGRGLRYATAPVRSLGQRSFETWYQTLFIAPDASFWALFWAAGLWTAGLVVLLVDTNTLAVLVPEAVGVAAGVAAIISIYWRVSTGSVGLRPYALAFVLSLFLIELALSTFTGFTVRDLSQQSTAGTHAGDVGAVLPLYLWHLVDAVPLLGIPKTYHWAKPRIVMGPTGRGLVLTFRVVVLLPIAYLGIRGYYLARTKWLEWKPREREWLSNPWACAGALALLAVALYFFCIFPLDDSWALSRAVRHAWPRQSWAPGLVQLLLLLIVLYWLLATVYFILLGDWSLVGVGSVVGGIFAWLAVCGIIFEVGVAMNVVVLHLGGAGLDPAVGSSREVPDMFAAYGRDVVDSFPGLSVPDTLGWRAGVEATGIVSYSIVLAVKASILLCIALPIAYAWDAVRPRG